MNLAGKTLSVSGGVAVLDLPSRFERHVMARTL